MRFLALVRKTIFMALSSGISFLMLAGCVSGSSSSSFDSSESASGYPIGDNDNRNGSVGYEIFVGSFCDSNGDGIGDLQGIISKLPYLKALGVHRLWLSPIFPSNTYHKYNASDYFSVDSSFGTLADLDDLVTQAHADGFEIILDMMFNHSSNTHPWFLQSAEDYRTGNSGEGSKKDWYCWSPSSKAGYNYSSLAGAYYESNFSSSMPEFNLDNPEVVDEFHKICSFWLKDHHIDGFRLDGVIYYYYLPSKATGDISKNVAFLKTLKNDIDGIKPNAYVVGEAWTYDQTEIAQYASSGFRFFNFPTSETRSNGMADAVQTVSGLNYFASALPKAQSGILSASADSEPCYFVSNHDMDRWGNYFSVKDDPVLAREFLANLYLLTPGSPWMYYGEEIEMKGNKGATSSDALRRSGMVWGEGVARCLTPESYVDTANDNVVGALSAIKDPVSFLSHIRQLIAVRNRHNDLFENGIYRDMQLYLQEGNNAIKNAVISFEIAISGKTYYLVHNKSAVSQNVLLPTSASLVEDVNTSIVASSVEGSLLDIKPYSSVLLLAE